MDFSWSKEQMLIQKMARDFAENTIKPALSIIEKENQVPPKILAGLAELDLFGLAMPVEYGGAGAGYDSYVLALEQIARISCGPALIISAHNLGLGVINSFGSEEQKKKYMPTACGGGDIASFAFTEPGTGSDPRQLTTRAVKDGKDYVVNGAKRFISNASYPGPLVVFALDSETGQPTAFIVEKNCPGYSVSEPWKKLGWHGGDLVDVYLRDVRIPAENVLGKAGDGYPILQYGIAFGKIGMNSVALGTTLAAYEEALSYARQKTHRGEPIAKFQAIQLRIAGIAMLYESSRWIAYRLGWLANQPGPDFVREAALAKAMIAENTVKAARIALDIHGSYGLMEDYDISRIYRDAVMGPQVEGVVDMQKIIAARDILHS